MNYIMKTENLQEGQIFKNYSEICSVLEVKPKAGGKSKSIQLEDWSRYFKYRKEGHKFVIEEIYPTPLENTKVNGRPSVYGNIVQLLILDLLGKSHGSILISANKLMEAIGMTNENYGKCQDNAIGLASYSYMSVGHVYDFYNVTGSGLRKIVKYALDNLEKKMIINYSKVVKVKERNVHLPRIASDEEVELLMDITKDILDELGFGNISDIRRSSKWGEFLKKKKNALSKTTNFEYDYSAYKIVINRKHIEKEKNKLASLILDEDTFIKEKSELNGLVIKNTIDNAKNRVVNIENTSEKLAKLRSEIIYVDNITTLCDLTVNKDKPTIYEEVRERQLSILKDLGTSSIDELL